MHSPDSDSPSRTRPEPVATPPLDRAAGLGASALRLLQALNIALRQRNAPEVQRCLQGLLALAPAHPEVLRARAAVAHLGGRRDEAIELLRRVVEARPNDIVSLADLGAALADHRDIDGAIAAFEQCVRQAPARVDLRLNLARLFDRAGQVERMLSAADAALDIEPGHPAASALRARALNFLGRADEATAEYRRMLDRDPSSVAAWHGLASWSTARFDDNDVASIEHLVAGETLVERERAAALFTLARALEDTGRHAEAFEILHRANATRRKQLYWDASAFSSITRAIEAAFDRADIGAEDSFGADLVFIVGMPRSGSTLIEQTLAAHPDVSAGGEIDVVNDIVRSESERRGVAFPDWVANATAGDWRRLGETYLDRTARLRNRRVFTDKTLLNWRYIGALHAMLPGARFIDCRRDAVETCLSCYRQLFENELAFTYDLAELASAWNDYDRAMRFWKALLPDRILTVAHEDLTARPDEEIRRLFDFCALSPDDAHPDVRAPDRTVQTASAAQVRTPIRRVAARAPLYGKALDPLRESLAGAADARSS